MVPRAAGDGDTKTEPNYVNGGVWTPRWDGSVSSKFESLEPPFPESSDVKMTLERITGRGSVSVVQQPTTTNNYEAVILLDDGNHPAQDWYEFQLSW